MYYNETEERYIEEFDFIDIPFSKCELGKNFFYSNPEELEIHNIDRYFCPDFTNLTI